LLDIAEDEGLIRPMKRKTDPWLGPDVVLALIPTDLEYLVKLNRGRALESSDLGHFKIYQLNEGDRGSLSFAGPFLGAPQAVMGMEKVIALGARRIWVWGWCGSLQPDLPIGNLVIPTRAISEEGTSQHYPVGDSPVSTDEALNQMIEEALLREGQSFHKGMTWTTDAPYRETRAKVKAYQERGVLAVEMEMSALITLAAYRSVKLTGLLVVSDELFDLKWHTGFSDPKFKRTSQLAGRLLWGLVESFHGQESR